MSDFYTSKSQGDNQATGSSIQNPAEKPIWEPEESIYDYASKYYDYIHDWNKVYKELVNQGTSKSAADDALKKLRDEPFIAQHKDGLDRAVTLHYFENLAWNQVMQVLTREGYSESSAHDIVRIIKAGRYNDELPVVKRWLLVFLIVVGLNCLGILAAVTVPLFTISNLLSAIVAAFGLLICYLGVKTILSFTKRSPRAVFYGDAFLILTPFVVGIRCFLFSVIWLLFLHWSWRVRKVCPPERRSPKYSGWIVFVVLVLAFAAVLMIEVALNEAVSATMPLGAFP